MVVCYTVMRLRRLGLCCRSAVFGAIREAWQWEVNRGEGAAPAGASARA